MKEGQKAYFVRSLWEPATPCTITRVNSGYNRGLKDRELITARDAAGQEIKGYSSQFTVTRPVPFH